MWAGAGGDRDPGGDQAVDLGSAGEAVDEGVLPVDPAEVPMADAYTGGGTDVMLQGFIWGTQGGWYTTVQNNAASIKAGGFTMVWMPPPSKAGAVQGYLPTEWNNLNSSYGTQAQLQSAITALHGQGVKVLADIVINHRNGCLNWADFCNPAFPNNNYAVTSNDEYFAAGNPGAGVSQRGASDSGEGYAAARDLDHTNGDVQNGITTWLNWLKGTIGFDGWRYDYVKGFGGGYVGQYNSATSPYFSVGEHWPTNSFDVNDPSNWRNQINNWISATGNRSAAFDFVTKPLLMQAFSYNDFGKLNNGGKPAGIIGSNPAYAVTFLDNHDTGPAPGGQNHWAFPSANVEQGYAYILTHPGTPSVFWSHYFDWGTPLQTAIKNMIAIRKAQGITSTSSVSIQAADSSRYAAIVNGNTAVKVGPGDWAPSAGLWVVGQSGTNYAIWQGATASTPAAPTGVAAAATSSSAISVSWTASTDATSYTVYRATCSTCTFSVAGTTSATSYGDIGLAASTAYYYYVTASNASGTSAKSSTVSATTLASGGSVTTTFRVHYDVGMGNNITLRGSLAPLSWTAGVATEWTTGNVWVYTTTAIASGAAFEYKALINDTRWSDGANFAGTGGATLDIYPAFNGNFYDTMDSIATNWAVAGGSTTGKWKQGTLNGSGVGACLNCSTESQLTLKNAISKTGTTVTLGFKYATKNLGTSEYLAVDVSTNSGSTWTQVASYTGTRGATNASINITAYKSTTMKLRFRVKSTGSTHWATVDNVTVAVR
ncbi:MAG: alpha-amylase C-terminal beta-sheet domain-containing protein [Anaeromyxobacter sp.]